MGGELRPRSPAQILDMRTRLPSQAYTSSYVSTIYRDRQQRLQGILERS